MTRLLILAYDFPPYVSVGGLRPFSWYKYLHLFDVQPVVVTRQWSNRFGNNLDYISAGYSDSAEVEKNSKGIVIKTPFRPNLGNRILLKYGENRFRLIRKLISSYFEFLQFIFYIGNKKELYYAAEEFLKNNKVDCIIATGDPFVLFKYASRLSRKYSVPWIADYRDAWIQDKTTKSRIYKRWCAFFEKRFLKNVNKITTVSTFIQKQIERNIKGKDFEIIYNGFDPEILKVTGGINQSGEGLSIAFAGTIYDSHPVESFLSGCDEILAENNGSGLEMHFYGINKEPEIKKVLNEKYRLLEKHTHFHPRMDNLELAKAVSRQNVCLLFNDYSVLGTKIFDYLAVRRKIVLCYENDAEAERLKKEFFWIDEIETESKRLQADMIIATNSGIVINDSRHLKETLRELIIEVRENGFVSCASDGIEQYSRVRQTGRLAEIIKNLR